MKSLAIGLVSVLALGCGGSSGESAHEEHAEGEHHHGHHGGEHAGMPQNVHQLHEVVAAVWHAEPGPGRGQLACDRHADLTARTDAVVDGPVPESAAARENDWQAATARMRAAVQAIGMACQGPDAAATAEARLTSMHDAFHQLAELAGGGHDR